MPPGRQRPDAPEPTPAEYGPEDFPDCESFHLPASEIDHYEGRLEFWHGRTETTWKICEPTSIQYEGRSRRLVQMAERVASLRGSRIPCFGSADVVYLDTAGRNRGLMQVDDVLYLHPDRIRLQGPAIDVDRDLLPDVVLEMDHTTFRRRIRQAARSLVPPPARRSGGPAGRRRAQKWLPASPSERVRDFPDRVGIPAALTTRVPHESVPVASPSLPLTPRSRREGVYFR